MKQGEKRAFIFIFIAIAVIILFTVQLEIDHQKHNPSGPTLGISGEPLKESEDSVSIWVIPKGLNPNDLPDAGSRGAVMLEIYCTQCHELPTPLMHNKAEWIAVVDRMFERMQSRKGGMLSRLAMPSEKDWQVLRAYLAQNAQKSLARGKYSDLGTPSGQAFQQTCSQCHAAPDPASHKANEWPRVVVRMKANMQAARIAPPDDNTQQQIIQFLQRHAAK